MKTRICIAGVVVLGLVATSGQFTPAYSRLACSARTVQRYVDDLRSPGSSLSPMERLLFRLVLDNNATSQNRPAAAPDHRG